MRKKDKLLVQLIKTVELDGPSPDFTENVMDYLKREDSLIKERDSVYKHYLNKDVLPSLPEDFSSRTLHLLGHKEKKPDFKPLITKWNGAIVITGFVIFYFFLWIDELFLHIFHYSEGALSKMVRLQDILSIPPIFWVSIMAFTVLLLLDYFIKKNSWVVWKYAIPKD